MSSGAASVEEELDGIAGRLNAEHGRLVDVAVQLLAEPDCWRQWECRSLDSFLAWRTGVTPSTAAKIVQIARRVDDLPHCVEALRSGRLSLDQLAPIARRVPWWADVEICRQAQLMTVEQVRRTASTYPFVSGIPKSDGSTDGVGVPRSDGDVPGGPDDRPIDVDRAAAEPEHGSMTADVDRSPGDADVADDERVAFWWDDDGRFRLSATVAADVGAVVESALVEARDASFRAGDESVSWVAALAEVAQRSLDAVETPDRRSRCRVHVHVETDRRMTSATGRRLPDDVAEFMCCDALRSATFEVDGLPLSVGRSQRTVPDRTRQAVIHRDGGCRVPGCSDTRWLDVHHIVHWLDGGPTDTDNLICVCRRHHRQHHRGRLGISGNADRSDGVVFTNARGAVMAVSGARPTPPGARSATRPSGARYQPAVRERLESRWQHFNPPPGFRHLSA